MNNAFDSVMDRRVIEFGGFFCKACLAGCPTDEQSSDPRYCTTCYHFLLKEAEECGRGASWVPIRPDDQGSDMPLGSGDTDRGVSKLRDKELGVPASTGVLFHKHPGGRPRKQGQVSRTTEWRRRQEGLQRTRL